MPVIRDRIQIADCYALVAKDAETKRTNLLSSLRGKPTVEQAANLKKWKATSEEYRNMEADQRLLADVCGQAVAHV